MLLIVENLNVINKGLEGLQRRRIPDPLRKRRRSRRKRGSTGSTSTSVLPARGGPELRSSW